MRGASTSDRDARAQDEIARGGGPQIPAALGLRLECGGSPAYSLTVLVTRTSRPGATAPGPRLCFSAATQGSSWLAVRRLTVPGPGNAFRLAESGRALP